MTARDLAAMKRLEKWRKTNREGRGYSLVSPDKTCCAWCLGVSENRMDVWYAPTLAEAVDKALGKKGKGK